MAYTTGVDNRGIWLGGITAGIVAGIVMAMFAMGYAMWMGDGLLAPLKMIAATLYGKEAMTGGAAVLLTGLLTHMMVSAVFGIIFAYLVKGISTGAALLWGLLYGVAIWAVMGYAVVPVVNSVMAEGLPKMRGAFFFEHLLFGATLLVTPGLVRRFSARPVAWEEERRRAA